MSDERRNLGIPPPEKPRKGLSVSFVGANDLYALMQDPFTDDVQGTHYGDIPLQDTERMRDPLLARMTSRLFFVQDDYRFPASFDTEFYFSDDKLTKDGGYYSKSKRAEISKKFEALGFTPHEVFSDDERFSLPDSFNIPAGFYIRYGSPTKEDHIDSTLDSIRVTAKMYDTDELRHYVDTEERGQERLLEEGLKNEKISLHFGANTLKMDEEAFVRYAKAYGLIYETVLKTLYEVDGQVPPTDEIILAAPLQQDITDV